MLFVRPIEPPSTSVGWIPTDSGFRQSTTFFDQRLLHPALQIDQSVLDRLWARGFSDADHHRHDMPFLKNFQRGIGTIRTAPLRHETVSWLLMSCPETVAYYSGFMCRKDYWGEQEKQSRLATLRRAVAGGRRSLSFYGTLNILPSFGGTHGRVDRSATPRDLKDVRVVLKVGDRIYQPFRQPGDLAYRSEVGTNTFAVPQSSQEVTSTTVQAANGSEIASGNSLTTNYYTVFATENFMKFTGQFSVAFDLFDTDGKPRITPTDREVEVIVVYGPSERHVKYDLDELLKLRG